MFIYLAIGLSLFSSLVKLAPCRKTRNMDNQPAGKADTSMKNQACWIGFAPELLSTI